LIVEVELGKVKITIFMDRLIPQMLEDKQPGSTIAGQMNARTKVTGIDTGEYALTNYP
jgi:aspartyl aminopeptidase